MKKSLPVFLTIFGVCATALAQDTPSATGEARPKPAPEKRAFVPTATPSTTAAQESPGVLQRIFGSRQGRRVLFPPTSTPTPQATPPATPAPKTSAKARPKKRQPKPAPDATESAPAPAKTESPAAPKPAPDQSATPAPDQSATPAPAPVVPDAPPPAAPAAPAPAKKVRKGKTAPPVAAPKGVKPAPDADPEAREKTRFDQAKAKASEDPEVMELKTKADSAVSDEDAKSAQRAYNKALFNQMRKIDSSLDGRINAMEAAILQRLDEK